MWSDQSVCPPEVAVPRPRFEKLPLAKRRRILETAAVEFATRGFDAASLNRIIRSARISKGAAYYYFDDKADLYTAVVAYGWQQMLPKEETDITSLTAASFWPTLRRLCLEFLSQADERPWIMAFGKLIYGPPPSPAVAREVERSFARARTWLGALVAHGQRLGVVRTDLPGDLILMMLAALIEASDRWFLRQTPSLDEREAERLTTTLFGMLERLSAPDRSEAAP
jgi:AcrR family transcriptional regulator